MRPVLGAKLGAKSLWPFNAVKTKNLIKKIYYSMTNNVLFRWIPETGGSSSTALHKTSSPVDFPFSIVHPIEFNRTEKTSRLLSDSLKKVQ